MKSELVAKVFIYAVILIALSIGFYLNTRLNGLFLAKAAIFSFLIWKYTIGKKETS